MDHEKSGAVPIGGLSDDDLWTAYLAADVEVQQSTGARRQEADARLAAIYREIKARDVGKER